MGLRSAYFPVFKWGPKVLFWGDAEAKRQLAGILEIAATQAGPHPLDWLCEFVDGKPIVLQVKDQAVGMTASQEGFAWIVSSEQAVDFASMINVLAESNTPGHQYLECGTTREISVMVSRGEYPDDLHPRNTS
jgi:hypothetical protein